MIIDYLMILAGITILTFLMQFSRALIRFQNKQMHYNLGERDARGNAVVGAIVGVAFIVMGVMRITHGN